MIVIALLGVLAAVLISNLDNIFGGGQEKLAHLWVNESVRTPLMAYRLDMGNYPSTEEGLSALITAPAGKNDRWKGPYLEKLPLDPWNNPYQYRFPGIKNTGKYDVWSRGRDAKDSEDDIGNW